MKKLKVLLWNERRNEFHEEDLGFATKRAMEEFINAEDSGWSLIAVIEKDQHFTDIIKKLEAKRVKPIRRLEREID